MLTEIIFVSMSYQHPAPDKRAEILPPGSSLPLPPDPCIPLEVVTLVGKRRVGSRSQVAFSLFLLFLGELNLGRSKGNTRNKFLIWSVEFRQNANKTHQALVADELPSEPQEWLFEVVVGLGRNLIVLNQVLLAVERDRLGLHFALLNIDLVAAKDDWDVLANTDKVTCFE